MDASKGAAVMHVFVVNPAAGYSSAEGAVRQSLRAYGGALDSLVHVTNAPGEATRFVRAACEKGDAPLRFYACGGDGTLNEVVNGAAGFSGVSVACWPCGSGNDYVKYYGGRERFLDLAAQVEGAETPVDLMRVGDRAAINMVHFGFDSRVAETMARVKRLPLVGGQNAYYTGIIKTFFSPFKNRCTVWVDGEKLNDGLMLLCTVACGQYVGGSFRSAPRSDNADGLMDVCLVKPISRARFFSLIGPYERGEHLENAKFGDCLVYRRGRTVSVRAEKPSAICMDGEIIRKQAFEISVQKQALRFVVPRGAKPIPAAVT